jgi:hypothetical protein
LDDTVAAEWFKLLLLDETDMDEERSKFPRLQMTRLLLQEANKTPLQAVANYLRLLWRHTMAQISRNLGEVTVEGLEFQVVCTVPAVWRTAAVSKMRMAAENAGITAERIAGTTILTFVTEHEAAALATFEDLKARPNIKSGDVFVVCDAGDEMVSPTSYKVTSTEPLQLDECVESSGKPCGGAILDEVFEKMISQQLGDAWNVPDSIKRDSINKEWEHGIKRAFEDQEQSWKLTLPYPCVMLGAAPTIILPK